MILLADSGSTKTDWRLLCADGSITQARTAGFNPFYQDSDAVATELAQHLRPLVTEAVTAVFFYGAGITDAARGAVIADGIRRIFPEITRLETHSDMLGAARALCGRERGIACILGTGANTCLADGGEIREQVRSLGFWLGDEGSGGFLGKTLVTHFLHHELPADLEEAFRRRFPDCTRDVVLDRAYRQPFPNRYFAGFSKFLFDHRQHPFAYGLVTGAFGLFFGKYVEKYPEVRSLKIHFTGSVAFYYSDILRHVAADRGLTLYHAPA